MVLLSKYSSFNFIPCNLKMMQEMFLISCFFYHSPVSVCARRKCSASHIGCTVANQRSKNIAVSISIRCVAAQLDFVLISQLLHNHQQSWQLISYRCRSVYIHFLITIRLNIIMQVIWYKLYIHSLTHPLLSDVASNVKVLSYYRLETLKVVSSTQCRRIKLL